MSSIFIHDDPELFPEPRSFRPHRWLNKDRTRLEKYLTSFGKGTRSCLGMNLARVEIFLVLACMFRVFDLELFETDLSDVEMVHDFVIPVPRLDSKGVRVLIKG
jgi:cytochrome P450